VSERGEIVETMARELRTGDYVAAVRRIDGEFPDAFIDVYALEQARAVGKEIGERVRQLVKKARRGGISVDLSEGTLDSIGRKRGVAPKLAWIKKLCAALGEKLPAC